MGRHAVVVLNHDTFRVNQAAFTRQWRCGDWVRIVEWVEQHGVLVEGVRPASQSTQRATKTRRPRR